jgi:catechol 2,3-dioxygenase-like lactoylglutathione lyase family enzyme
MWSPGEAAVTPQVVAPAILAVVETAVYSDNLVAAEAFYGGVLGLPVVAREPGRHVFFRAGDAGMLLVFDPAATRRGGELPPHGTAGPGHFALGVRAEDLDGWKTHLAASGVAIERELVWPRRPVGLRPGPGRQLGRAGHARRVGHAGRVVDGRLANCLCR